MLYIYSIYSRAFQRMGLLHRDWIGSKRGGSGAWGLVGWMIEKMKKDKNAIF